MCLFYGLDFSLYDNIIMKSISDFGVWEMMRFKQVSIGLMVFFAMMNIFCTLVWSQTLWSTKNMIVFLFCSWCCYFNSTLAEKKKIDHPSSLAKLSQIGLSLMRWSYQCVISFWYHGVWEMMSWQCNAYSNSKKFEDHKQMMS